MKIIDLFEDDVSEQTPIEMALDIAETESSHKWADIVLRNYFKKNPNNIAEFGKGRINNLMKYIDSLKLNFDRLSRISVPQAIMQSEKSPSKRSIKKLTMQVPNPKDITEDDIIIDRRDKTHYAFKIGPYQFFASFMGDDYVNLGWGAEHKMQSLFDAAKKRYGGTGIVKYIAIILKMVTTEYLKDRPDVKVLQIIGYDEKRGNFYAKFSDWNIPGFNPKVVKNKDGTNRGIEFINAKNS